MVSSAPAASGQLEAGLVLEGEAWREIGSGKFTRLSGLACSQLAAISGECG